MKISRIDIIGQNGNDGDHYEGVGAQWLTEHNLLDQESESTAATTEANVEPSDASK